MKTRKAMVYVYNAAGELVTRGETNDVFLLVNVLDTDGQSFDLGTFHDGGKYAYILTIVLD